MIKPFKLRLLLICFITATLTFVSISVNADSIKANDRVESYLNVREQPNTKSSVVGVLRPNQTAELIESIPYWHHIRLTSGTTGYVSKAWSVIVTDTSQTSGKTDLVIGSWNIKWFGNKSEDKRDYSQMADSIEKLQSEFNVIKNEVASKEIHRIEERLERHAAWSIKSLGVIITLLGFLITGAIVLVERWLSYKINFNISRSRKLFYLMTTQFFRRTAWVYNNTAVNDFYDGKVSLAINNGHSAVDTLSQAKKANAYGEDKSKTLDDLLKIFKMPTERQINFNESLYKINLAYYYAKKKDKSMKDKAIKWAKMGLKEVRSPDDIDLIDSYLYILVQFWDWLLEEEKEKGRDVYVKYKSGINRSIRISSEQKQRFDKYFSESEDLTLKWLCGMWPVYSFK